MLEMLELQRKERAKAKKEKQKKASAEKGKSKGATATQKKPATPQTEEEIEAEVSRRVAEAIRGMSAPVSVASSEASHSRQPSPAPSAVRGAAPKGLARTPPTRVQVMLEMLELQRKERAKAKKEKQKKASAEKGKSKGATATQKKPATPQTEEEIEAEVSRRVAEAIRGMSAPVSVASSEASHSRQPSPAPSAVRGAAPKGLARTPPTRVRPTAAPQARSESSWNEAGSTVQSFTIASEKGSEPELLTPRTMMIRAMDRLMATEGANANTSELCNRLFDHLGVETQPDQMGGLPGSSLGLMAEMSK